MVDPVLWEIRRERIIELMTIVIADVRAPRDGKFIEMIGTYNPNTNPATVDLKFDRALDWVLKGAQPTDTVRNILSREDVYKRQIQTPATTPWRRRFVGKAYHKSPDRKRHV